MTSYVVATDERDSFIESNGSYMTDENPDIQLPDNGDEAIEIAEAETDEEKALATIQARLIGDL